MILKSLQEQCAKNTQGCHVICLQDTTEYNYNRHQGRLKKETIGIVGNNVDYGFFAHVMVCFDSQNTLPVGIAYCKQWGREPGRLDCDERKYKTLPIEEKESFRWIEAAFETKKVLQASSHLTLISDRESDIYQFWDRVPDKKTDLIIRAKTDRCVYDKKTTVFRILEEQSVVGDYLIELKEDKRKARSRRIAKLNIKFANVLIRKPGLGKAKKTNDPDFINIYAIEAKEDQSTIKHGEATVHWVLFTTHQVNDVEQAKQIIQWYSFRWQIEQFFRITKKQGIDAESSQLETGEALMKLGLVGFSVALKILQLTLAREGKRNDKAEKYFEPDEIIVLKVINENIQGGTVKQQNPFPKETLAWAAWIIARLGGYSGYKSQPPPGPITFKWGLDKLSQLVLGFNLAKNVYKE